MKKYIFQSIRLTAVLMVLLCAFYPMIVAFAGSFSSGKGGGEKVYKDGKVVGYTLLGQSFKSPAYFWGRSSAVDYHADGSAGSNKGPSNPEYLQQVSDRIDTLMKYHAGLRRSAIPADMVTASGSGLDPNISEQGALIQIGRVAAIRGLSKKTVTDLVNKHTQGPFLGYFGPTKVNVFKLNLALDELTTSNIKHNQ